MRKGLLILLTTLATNFVYSQNCSCSDIFVWLKETIEKNDAGFQYVIDQKGETEYKKHSDSYAEKVKSITDTDQCAETLSEWLKFFRKGHLWFGVNFDKEHKGNSNQTDTEKIKKQFKDWETYPYQEKEFNNYITKMKEPGLEGIWTTPPYTIGVRKVKNEYIGFIIEADGVYWSKSQVKFKIKDENGNLTATYYMQDHSAKTMKDVALLGNNYLQIGWVTLKRVKPVFPADKSLDITTVRLF